MRKGRLFCIAGLLFATLVRAETAFIPVSDYQQILNAQSPILQVFDYSGRQPVYILDFPTLAEQGRTFNRIVALIERIGVARARVLDDIELAAFIRATGKTEYTFAYGNDLLVSELVIFFNLAEHNNIALNEEEQRLRSLLFERGLIRERYGFLQAVRPSAVILSIPQQKQGGGEPPVDAAARQTILTHELAHAEYYTNPDYRAWCRKFWHEILTERQRESLRAFLARSGYDPHNEELMINETQAYLSFTPDPRAFSAKLAGLSEAELNRLRHSFQAGAPAWPLQRK
jgi:hypothetical protein